MIAKSIQSAIILSINPWTSKALLPYIWQDIKLDAQQDFENWMYGHQDIVLLPDICLGCGTRRTPCEDGKVRLECRSCYKEWGALSKNHYEDLRLYHVVSEKYLNYLILHTAKANPTWLTTIHNRKSTDLIKFRSTILGGWNG